MILSWVKTGSFSAGFKPIRGSETCISTLTQALITPRIAAENLNAEAFTEILIRLWVVCSELLSSFSDLERPRRTLVMFSISFLLQSENSGAEWRRYAGKGRRACS